MLIIPVMYLRGGSVLKPAGAGGAPVKSDPIELAHNWFKSGAELMHIVDLDTPPAGHSPNTEMLKRFKAEIKMDFEVEGNIRAADTVERYISAGASQVVIGAAAYQKPAFLADVCSRFPGRVAATIDVRRGRVIIKGWSVAANKTDIDYVKQFKEAGVDTIFYSNTEEEGVLKTADFGRIRDFLRKAMIKTIHTTDISSGNDVENLIMLESYGLLGTLVSRSIYEGRIDLEGAITISKERAAGLDEPTYTEEGRKS